MKFKVNSLYFFHYPYHLLTMSNKKYIDIADEISSRIVSGEYLKGSKLPTHRALAEEFSTTAVTIAKAYKVLVEQKKVESFVGKGTFVCNNTDLAQVIHSRQDDQTLNLSILQPCLEHNMDSIMYNMQSCLTDIIKPELFGYTEDTGLIRHRESGVSWARQYGVEVSSAEQLLLANGAQHALSTLIQLYTRPGETIAVEAQTYPGILSIAAFLGRRVVGIKIDDQGMDPADLEANCIQQKIAMVVVIPSHQNPTGATMPAERRAKLAAIVERFQLWLVEDDIYGFLNEAPIAAITNLVPQYSFHISSLSKAISPGLRCAYIKVPESQSSNIAAFIRATLWLPPPFMFEVASSLINSGEAFSLAKKQREIARHRQLIAGNILNGYSMSRQATSYHLWLQLPHEWQADSFSLAAREQNILVSSASYFKAESLADNAIRLSLMAISDDDLYRQALEKLARLLQEGSVAHRHF